MVGIVVRCLVVMFLGVFLVAAAMAIESMTNDRPAGWKRMVWLTQIATIPFVFCSLVGYNLHQMIVNRRLF